MARETVQSLMLKRLDGIEAKLDIIMPKITALEVRASIYGGVSGIVGAALVGAIVKAWF